MRQLILTDVQKIENREVEIPEVNAGWVLIKTVRCGLCGTDAHSYMGETIFGKVFPFHIGHEACGYIEKIGSEDSALEIGDLVTLNPFFTCNSCPACYTDNSNNCSTKTTIGLKGPGGYSEYILVPTTSVYKVDKDTDIDRLTFAEPLANIVYAMEKLKIDHTSNVLINGVGAIGLMFLQLVLGHNPKSVTTCDFNSDKLEKSKQLGANRTINPKSDSDDKLYELIIDCTGSSKCVESSFEKLSFGGQLMNFGVCPIDSKINISPFDLYKRDATFLSSFALNKSSMQKAVDILSGDSFNTEILIDSVQPLSELENSILKMVAGKTTGKIIIDTTK